MPAPASSISAAYARDMLVRACGQEAAVQLGKLLLSSAIDTGLRRQDGNHYAPSSRWLRHDSAATRQSIRERLPTFLELLHHVDADPDLRPILKGPWQQIWHDPLACSQLAAALRPVCPEARLTLAVNHLRTGQGEVARRLLCDALPETGGSPPTQAKYLRNLAACYEVLGDDQGALWFAQKSFTLCPSSWRSLASYLIYSVVAPGVGHRLGHMSAATGLHRHPLRPEQAWHMLRNRGGRASERLALDSTLENSIRNAVLH